MKPHLIDKKKKSDMENKLPLRNMPFSLKSMTIYSVTIQINIRMILSISMRVFFAVWSISISLNLRGYHWFMSGSKHAHLQPAGLEATLPYPLVYLSIKLVFSSSKIVCSRSGSDRRCPLLTQFFIEERNDPSAGDW